MTSHLYADKYLAALVTSEIAARAESDVSDLGAMPAAWRTRLEILRAYIIVCLESMKAPEDLFSAKLAAYRADWKEALPQARAAQATAEAAAAAENGTAISGGSSFFSVALERS
jgi:hypothetical protein